MSLVLGSAGFPCDDSSVVAKSLENLAVVEQTTAYLFLGLIVRYMNLLTAAGKPIPITLGSVGRIRAKYSIRKTPVREE